MKGAPLSPIKTYFVKKLQTLLKVCSFRKTIFYKREGRREFFTGYLEKIGLIKIKSKLLNWSTKTGVAPLA